MSMTVVSLSVPDAIGRESPTHVVEDSDGAVLAIIRAPEINLAIWRRPLGAALVDWIGRLDLQAIEDLRFETALATLDEDIRDGLGEAGYPEGDILAADIVDLARHVMSVTGEEDAVIRLEIVEDDACRRFHADYVTARLICTYAGLGTQWLSSEDAAARDAGMPLAEHAIRSLAAGDVGLFKGRIWAPENAIIHRSPPISGTGAKRLVLVVSPGREKPAVLIQ
ncbi:hypothetical protein Sj15T_11770 [Sphingobium sp. TA15]|uniref:DUF1826 domain-containing protein n=1 Tax=Sphingobium indicum (strain DSM 16413 / CCM 7287 / MTCC 6362 / UT26 / NBRC 101211 / UT26S) TaxID=452662 RepID=D4Z289_SPHIU|nr:DUF1826 domain-containing protein [Sphingobium indicum]BAI96721.1 hypothetical protein SJA_C1-18870 [Sphingobium indicum UT26S]BDD66156.1 hypothetical protein Sj15T_11770 [Sphingobium sp. TA15]